MKKICALIAISMIPLKGFSIGISTGSSIYSNFKSKNTGENSLINVVFAGVNHQAGEFSLGMNSSATKNLNDQYSNYELGNIAISASHRISLENMIKFNSTYRSTIATSKFSRDIQNMHASVGHSLAIPIIIGESTNLGIGISNNVFFYEYENDLYGNSNVLHQHSLSLSLGHQIYEWLGASASISATKSFTHNNVATDSYVVSAGLNAQYKFLGIGLSYEKFDQWLDPSGQRANMSLFNLDSSMFGVTISTSF